MFFPLGLESTIYDFKVARATKKAGIERHCPSLYGTGWGHCIGGGGGPHRAGSAPLRGQPMAFRARRRPHSRSASAVAARSSPAGSSSPLYASRSGGAHWHNEQPHREGGGRFEPQIKNPLFYYFSKSERRGYFGSWLGGRRARRGDPLPPPPTALALTSP